jgi:hypothetical protein
MKRKNHPKRKSIPAKSILRLPDLEVAKNAVINSLSCPDANVAIATQSMNSLNGTAPSRGYRSAGP